MEISVGSSIESVRAALAAYTADGPGNTFPGPIADWHALRILVNANGGTFPRTEKEARLVLRQYTPIDENEDGVYENYAMSFCLPSGFLGLVSPSEITKKTEALKCS